MDKDALIKDAKNVENYLMTIREVLHKIPEVRWEETETIRRISDEIHLTINNLVGCREYKGGLVVDLDFDPSFDRILFRADIDALPIHEKTNLLCSSIRDGFMHACGHDIHAAMLLAFYRAIMTGKIKPKHNLRLVWQRAEENPLTKSGGATLVEEGVCKDITNAYALHIWLDEEGGSFSSRPGRMLANSDRIKVVIKCSGGHVAMPQHGSNAIDIGMKICSELEGFPLRFLGPNEPTSVVPAQFHSGASSNTRPDSAELWFSARNLLFPDKRTEFHEALANKIKDIVAMYPDATVEVKSVYGHPMLHNDVDNYNRVKELLEASDQRTLETEIIYGGEDFAHYLNEVPGSMWLLNAMQEGCGHHHTPTFDPDPHVFWKGVLFWLLLATS